MKMTGVLILEKAPTGGYREDDPVGVGVCTENGAFIVDVDGKQNKELEGEDVYEVVAACYGQLERGQDLGMDFTWGHVVDPWLRFSRFLPAHPREMTADTLQDGIEDLKQQLPLS